MIWKTGGKKKIKGVERTPPINSSATGKLGKVSQMNNITAITHDLNKNLLHPKSGKK